MLVHGKQQAINAQRGLSLQDKRKGELLNNGNLTLGEQAKVLAMLHSKP